MRFSTLCILFLAVAVTACSMRAASAGEAVVEDKIRVLLVTGGHGFAEEPFYALFDAIPDVTYTKAVFPAAGELLTPKLAKDYDVIVFYDMWAKGITSQQQEAFVALLQSGVGVVALHHTLAAHANWPQYAKIIGGKYHLKDQVVNGKTIAKSGFLHDQDIHVKVADHDHPIVSGLQDFEIHDETYRDYDTDPKANVLLTTSNATSDPELAWVTSYGNSRVFYLQLGHDRNAYQHATYRQLVARGIRWSAGRPTDPTVATAALFNGKDLSGWKAEGDARWEVKDGILIGRQGPNNEPGDLLTTQSYDDFELKVTFKVEWPANTGVWYRYQSAKKAFQADVLEYKKPFALTGSLYCTGKMFLAVNTDAALVNREGWNTLLIRAVGNRHMIFLNGKKVADVRDDTSDHGRIGFQVHAGAQFEPMRVLVKEVVLRRI
ncbi:MAG TPA: ThuA domain-containing protein [Pirellulaceae bacterium]|nr:ThuA domain-containing protein [Pirellulaceae bacterium]